MGTFDVQAIEIDAPSHAVFGYLADPTTLPEWTDAFERVDGSEAVMRTPAGSSRVELVVHASANAGTVDWEMQFPNGDVAWAWARVVPHRGHAIMTFVLPAPPVPLEQLEGTLAQQSAILAGELRRLAARFAPEAAPLP